jgi:hypothetical protein
VVQHPDSAAEQIETMAAVMTALSDARFLTTGAMHAGLSKWWIAKQAEPPRITLHPKALDAR